MPRVVGSYFSNCFRPMFGKPGEIAAVTSNYARVLLVSVRRVLESYESPVMQGWWPDSRRGSPMWTSKNRAALLVAAPLAAQAGPTGNCQVA